MQTGDATMIDCPRTVIGATESGAGERFQMRVNRL